jgi:hypothetical protein
MMKSFAVAERHFFSFLQFDFIDFATRKIRASKLLTESLDDRFIFYL